MTEPPPALPAPQRCAKVRAMAFRSFQGPDFSFFSPAAEQGPLATQLADAYQRAHAAGRVPCVYLTASWCPPSVQLEKSLNDPRMQRALRDVDAATFDIDTFGQALTDAGFRADTVPVFYLIDAEGRPAGKKITGAAWQDNTPENMAPPLERFFDQVRTSRPAPDPAPPPLAAATPPATSSKLVGILMLVVAIALLGVGAWLKVSSDEEQRKRDNDERLQQDIQRSIQQSLQKKSPAN